MSPTARTLARLRDRGMLVQVVEHFNSFTKRRIDLFGFIDVVALDPNTRQIVGVQCTVGDRHADHLRKITVDKRKEALMWLVCGGRIELWSWRKVKVKRGGVATRWEPRIAPVTKELLRATDPRPVQEEPGDGTYPEASWFQGQDGNPRSR